MSRTQFWKAVNVLEYKFLSIPIAFFLLRMWTCIINLIYYIDIEGVEVPQFIVYLSVSVYMYIGKFVIFVFYSHVHKFIIGCW